MSNQNLNCELLSQTLNYFRRESKKLESKRSGDVKKDFSMVESYQNLLGEIEQFMESFDFIDQKIVDDSQWLCEILGINASLKTEYEENRIIQPNIKEYYEARKNGFTKAIIVPGRLDNYVAWDGFKKRFSVRTLGVNSLGWEQTTESSYVLMVRPEKETVDFKKNELRTPDTNIEKLNFLEIKKEIVGWNKSHPALKVKNLSLTEYILFHAGYYGEKSRELGAVEEEWAHPDCLSPCLILDENFEDPMDGSLNCLEVQYMTDGIDYGMVRFSLTDLEEKNNNVRLGIVPKKLKPNY